MIMRVQAALFARGYDPGGIDGTLGPQTRMALELFQSRHGLPVTGTMSTETLNALGIALAP
jgi:His-Xaa-Ser repeat protein HxsA